MTLVTERPGPGQPRPYRFPPVVRYPAAGGDAAGGGAAAGGTVVAAHLPGQPLAVARLLLDAGAGREPAGREGVASVLADALAEGTAARDAAGYALALEGLGGELSTVVNWDSFRAGVTVPVQRLPAAVELLAEAVRAPRLDPADVIRVRDDALTALRMSWAEPGPRADAALRADLFGAGQRYARPLHGDPGSVAAIGVDDVVAYHGAWLNRPGTLLVAGDLDRLDLAALAAAAFAGTTAAGIAGAVSRSAAGGMPAGAGDRGGSPQPGEADAPLPVRVRDGRRIILVDRPGAVQSTLRLGHTAPHRAHPDFVPLVLAGTVLGGAFTSRLNHLIREVRGYTYGMRADFAMARRFGRFTVSASVHTAATAPAVCDTVAEITRTQVDGVTDAELAVARTWRAGQLSVEMQTPGAIAEALGTLVVHGLPDDYHATLRAQLLDTPAEVVSAAAAAHLRAQQLTLVVEGDAATVHDDLTATGLGELTTWAT